MTDDRGEIVNLSSWRLVHDVRPTLFLSDSHGVSEKAMGHTCAEGSFLEVSCTIHGFYLIRFRYTVIAIVHDVIESYQVAAVYTYNSYTYLYMAYLTDIVRFCRDICYLDGLTFASPRFNYTQQINLRHSLWSAMSPISLDVRLYISRLNKIMIFVHLRNANLKFLDLSMKQTA